MNRKNAKMKSAKKYSADKYFQSPALRGNKRHPYNIYKMVTEKSCSSSEYEVGFPREKGSKTNSANSDEHQ